MKEPESAGLTATPPTGEWVAVALSPAEMDTIELLQAAAGKNREEVVADAVQQFLLEQGWTPPEKETALETLLAPLTSAQMRAMQELAAGKGLRRCPGEVVKAALVQHAARYNQRWPYPGRPDAPEFRDEFREKEER